MHPILVTIWLLISSLMVIIPIYKFVNIDYYCITDKSHSWCDYFIQTNITIIDYNKNEHYVGQYFYHQFEKECILNDYKENPPIGYSFIGYFQTSIHEKCVDEKHYKKYIKEKGWYQKKGDIIVFSLMYIILFPVLLVITFISLDDMEKKGNCKCLDYFNIRRNYILANQESVHNPINEPKIQLKEFVSVSDQIKNNHFVISPNLNDICIFCQEKLSFSQENVTDEKLIGLSCGHWFHKTCITSTDKNLELLSKQTYKCPTCCHV